MLARLRAVTDRLIGLSAWLGTAALLFLVLTVLVDLTVAIGVGVGLSLALKLLRRNQTDSDWTPPDP